MELALYKLIITPNPEDVTLSYVDEFGWINDRSFCVWIPYVWIQVFVEGLIEIFGYGLVEEGGFAANIQENCICINLSEALEDDLRLETVFPKDQYKH